jgi:maltooligosyltrehalose trehalohydrolase
MEFRGSPRGEPSHHLPPTAFVSFIQNHDQVGNRAFGDRISSLAPPDAVRALAAVYLLLPQIPMLFMGEEFLSRTPFPFFCHFTGDLANAVRDGRRAEFASFPEFADPARRDAIPDPTAVEAFASAKLDWRLAGEGRHGEHASFYRRLLRVRLAELAPRLKRIPGNESQYLIIEQGCVAVTWKLGDGSVLKLQANLKNSPTRSFVPDLSGRLLWRENIAATDRLDAWGVLWSLHEAGGVKS